MRYKVINDAKLLALIEQKEKIATEVMSMQKDMEKIEEDINKKVLKINRLNDKAAPLTKEHQEGESLGEYEEFSRLYLSGKDGDEDRELRLEIFDHLEEYKIFLKKQKEDKLKKENGDKSDSENKGNSK